MHLNECVDLYYDSNSFDPVVRSCINGWLFKSTTEFYGWDGDLHLNFMFGALCWSYTVAGIMMFWIKPTWTKKSSFPHLFFATVLTFVQGPLSFMADYMSMTKDSPIHVIDRCMATTNLIIQMWKICALFHYARPGTFYVHLSAITFAVFSFMNSQEAQQSQDAYGFIFWHNLWHIYPLLGIIIESFDYFYLGDYDHTIDASSRKRFAVSGNSDRWKLGNAIHKVLKRVKSSLYLSSTNTSVSFDEAEIHKEKKRL